jgi:thioredoxin-dependent peroxiredoxin
VIGVSFDPKDQSERFAKKFDFKFPLLSDTDRKIGLAYGACESPKDEFARRIAYLIDENGRIAEAHPKVDARTYPQEQLKSL